MRGSRSYREINQHPSLPWNLVTHGFLDSSTFPEIWALRKELLVCSVLVSVQARTEQWGGEKRTVRGGSKTSFWEGRPSWGFPPPLFFSTPSLCIGVPWSLTVYPNRILGLVSLNWITIRGNDPPRGSPKKFASQRGSQRPLRGSLRRFCRALQDFPRVVTLCLWPWGSVGKTTIVLGSSFVHLGLRIRSLDITDRKVWIARKECKSGLGDRKRCEVPAPRVKHCDHNAFLPSQNEKPSVGVASDHRITTWRDRAVTVHVLRLKW